MNISQLLEALKDPNVALSAGEKLTAGVSVAILSMVIVFIVLIIISTIIKVLQVDKSSNKNTQAVSANSAPSQPIVTEEVIDNEYETNTLIAVITAAIAMKTQNSENNIIVRKITRTNNSKTSWENMSKNITK